MSSLVVEREWAVVIVQLLLELRLYKLAMANMTGPSIATSFAAAERALMQKYEAAAIAGGDLGEHQLVKWLAPSGGNFSGAVDMFLKKVEPMMRMNIQGLKLDTLHLRPDRA